VVVVVIVKMKEELGVLGFRWRNEGERRRKGVGFWSWS